MGRADFLPIVGTMSDHTPGPHRPRVRGWAPALGLVLLVASGSVVDQSAAAGASSPPVPSHAIAVQPPGAPVFDADAPDPDLVRVGSTYFAFTTGTVLGNNLQVLVDTSGSPLSGWGAYTHTSHGSSALPITPGWEQPDTQTSPGVFAWGGRWLLYYDAAQVGHGGDTGYDCLSVATAPTLDTSHPVFTDNSSGPLLCQPGLGGAIDPSPFVDPATGRAYLIWKSNDGGSGQPARLWSQQLSPDGVSLVGSPTLVLGQDTVHFPWETTIENPSLALVGSSYLLMFSVGAYNSPSYAEAFATCAGPAGPCTPDARGPLLTSGGSASGPGGGSLFADQSGHWQVGYAAWRPGCTDYACGGARRLFVSPLSVTPLSFPVTGMASTPSGSGYWLVDAQGDVSVHGAAQSFGSLAGLHLNAPIDHIVATPDGRGYWLVASDGGTFTFGDAGFFGSMGGRHLNAPVVDLAPTPDGRGYWLVATDGGIFAFGDARFHGSMGGRHLNQPVVGISADNATGGYWEVATDGGIFAFGAPFRGSTGNLRLNRPVNGMSATVSGNGYWFVASDGGIFSFGDARFHGSMGGSRLNQPIVGMATDPATGGYWMVASDGGIFSFGAPFFGAD